MPKTRRSDGALAPADEKITLNLGTVDLGRIDLLVAEGLYANRADLIRTAIRLQLDRHEGVVDAAIARRTLVVGVRRITAEELRAAHQRGEPLSIHALGLVVIDPDITPALAVAAIASIEVLGSLQASAAVKAALKGRLL